MASRVAARRRARGWFAAALAVALTATALTATTMTGISTAVTTTGLRVSGNVVLLNKVPFVPRGFTMIGALAGPGCTGPDVLAASTHLSTLELDTLAVGWHANTVRFQVSQSALSNLDPAVVTAYLSTVAAAVALARSSHLVVILSMQDKELSCGPVHDFPSASTQRAWEALAPVYATATDVMYELFNEPVDITADQHPKPSTPLDPASWAEWLNGGTTPDPNQDGAIGHQQLLQRVRQLGAKNVVLVDGLNRAGILPGPNQGAALVHDTMVPSNVVYSVHPYYYDVGLVDWEFRFGALAQTVPVLATEWNYRLVDCGTAKQTLAPGFLAYLSDRGIGVLGMAGDLGIGLTLMADWSWTPSVCGAGPDGPGAAFRAYLAGTAAPRPTVLTVVASSPAVVGTDLVVTGTLLINGQPPTVGMVLTPSRKDGTVTTKLPTILTGVGGTFSFDGGLAAVAGKVKFTVKYAGNGVTKAAARTITVTVTS